MEKHPLDFLNPHELPEREPAETPESFATEWFERYHEKYGVETPATFDLFETLADAFKPK